MKTVLFYLMLNAGGIGVQDYGPYPTLDRCRVAQQEVQQIINNPSWETMCSTDTRQLPPRVCAIEQDI